jgi:hypothetical protein
MERWGEFRVLTSGADELGAGGVRPRHRLDGLGDASLEAEKPLHLAVPSAKWTLCGLPVATLREYPLAFVDQDVNLRCAACDEAAG